MKIKNTLTIAFSLIFTIFLIVSSIIYFSFAKSNQIFSIHTISGDESVMKDINITGSIGDLDYLKNLNVKSEITSFCVDIDGNLTSEHSSEKMKLSEYIHKDLPCIFAVETNYIIPTDAEIKIIGDVDDFSSHGEYLSEFDTNKYIPYFRFSLTHEYIDCFLIIKPDYYVEYSGEDTLKFYQNSGENPANSNEIFVFKDDAEQTISTNLLTTIIDDYYYMVLPTYQNSVGKNGIYKFKISDETISWYSLDVMENSNNNLRDNIAKEEYRYEKIANIPINIDGENDKIVDKMFDYNGNLYLISKQEIDAETERMYLSEFNLKENKFTKEISLGDFSKDATYFYNNDEFMTIQNDLTYITYNLNKFEIVNSSTLNRHKMTSNTFFNGDNLYLYNLIEMGRDYEESLVNSNYNNEILVYKNDKELYKGELHTEIYQDYLSPAYVNEKRRKILSFNFENKE